MIYGGFGNDFIHGGAGDDAISGAEAQAAFYNTKPVGDATYYTGVVSVTDPLNPLGYDPVTRKLAAYDANNPWTSDPEFLLELRRDRRGRHQDQRRQRPHLW